MDETWIHHFTPATNRQSAEWTAAVESRSKRPKTQTSAGKILASVSWDAQGILSLHRVTSQSQRWQNYMNCTSNCFCTHPILQIWLPVTIGCLQTSKEFSRERDLASIEK